MSELRHDALGDEWVIVNARRAERPKDITGDDGDRARCPFCPGHEHMTRPTLDAITDDDGRWLVRTVENLYPIVCAQTQAVGNAHHETVGGRHEVIIETRDHDARFALLPVAQLERVLAMYVRRYAALRASGQAVRHVALFRNDGATAGASLRHPHAQAVAVPVVHPELRRRIRAEQHWCRAHGHCGRCQALEAELEGGERLVHASSAFVTFAPFASRFPWQLAVVPRRHHAEPHELGAEERADLAAHLAVVLGAVHRELGGPDYNMVFMTPPLADAADPASHWYLAVVPRLSRPGGFEMATRIFVDAEPPERAARALRARIDDGLS